MKLLVVCHEYPPLGGGGGRQLMNLAKEYAKSHTVYFLTVGFYEFGITPRDGYTLHQLHSLRKRLEKPSNVEFLSFLYEAWKAIPRITHTFQPDAVHCFFSIPEGLLLFHPHLRNLPSVISVRGADVPGHDPDRFSILYKLVRPVVKRIWKQARHIVCNSRDLRHEVLRISPKLAIEVIPNGIDLERFRPAQPKRTSSTFIVLYVGRLIPLKRIDIVIRALAELRTREQAKNLLFRIVGIGDHRHALQRLVTHLKLENHVEFAGEIPYNQIHEVYQQADIYIQLSMVEGMSNAILEAMASGLPIITTNVGGASTFMSGNGVLVEHVSVEMVAESIDTYRKTPTLLATHGKRSRALIEQFNFEDIAQQYLRLFSVC